jgi:putative nucleotide binding protein
MASKIAGKQGRMFREHGIIHERKSCGECCWFRYSDYCLKWGRSKRPDNWSCIYFQGAYDKPMSLIKTWYSKKNSLLKEEFAYILDYLPNGRPDDTRPKHQKKPIVQGVAGKNIIFLEMVPKKGIIPKSFDRVYIGDGDRPAIDHVKRPITYDELTFDAKNKLEDAIEKIIFENENYFLSFLNKADWIYRKHMLSLIPGINDELQKSILKEREIKPFNSFNDITNRTGLFPITTITIRIMCELESPVKYLLFVDKKRSS